LPTFPFDDGDTPELLKPAPTKLPMDMGSRDDRDMEKQLATMRRVRDRYRAKKGLPPLP
jgi:hypothetical protein